MAESPRISVRTSTEFDKRLDKALEATGLTESSFVLAAVEALVEYTEREGEITLPLVVIPKSVAAKSKIVPFENRAARAAEDEGRYKKKKTRSG